MTLTWDKVRAKKYSQKNKEDMKRLDYIDKFDINKRINNLMKCVNENPPGTYRYCISDLTTTWEDINIVLGVLYGDGHPLWLRDKKVIEWLFEEILLNLRMNGVKYSVHKGFYAVYITMP